MTAPSPCPTHKTSAKRSTSIVACVAKAGYYGPAGAGVPSICPGGKYCPEGTVQATRDCSSGYYCPQGASQVFFLETIADRVDVTTTRLFIYCMYVCIYLSVYPSIHTYIHPHKYIHTYRCIHPPTHTNTYIPIDAYTHPHTQIHTYVLIHIIYTYISIHTPTHAHKYIHTFRCIHPPTQIPTYLHIDACRSLHLAHPCRLCESRGRTDESQCRMIDRSIDRPKQKKTHLFVHSLNVVVVVVVVVVSASMAPHSTNQTQQT